MWFGTQLGVSRFDGKEFTNYKMSEGLPNNFILTIFEDSDKNLWFGTRGGVSKFHNGSFNNYSKKNGLIDNNVLFIEESDKGEIILGTSGGVSILKQDTIVNYYSGNLLPSDNIRKVYKDKTGKIWIGTKNGLVVYRKGNVRVMGKNKKLSNAIIWDIQESQKGTIWVATQQSGLFRIKDNKIDNFTTEDGLASNMTLSLCFDQNGDLWIGHYLAGASRYDGDNFTTLKNPDINDKIILGIKSDTRGNTWFRSAKSGIFKYNGNKLRHFTIENNLIENYSDSKDNLLYVDREDNVWLGTISGISKYSKNIFEHFTEKHGLLDNNILAVAAIDNQNVWLSSYNGLMHYQGDKIKKYADLEDIYCMYPDVNGKVLLGSNKSLYVFQNGNLRQYKDTSIFKGHNDWVFDITKDNKGNYWLATDDGLIRYSEGKFYQEALDEVSLRGITLCKERLWLATVEGVYSYHLEDKYIDRFSEDKGLPNNLCHDIIADTNCNVWVGTDNGLAKISQNEDEFVIDQFSTKHNLTSNTIYLLEFDENNNLWLGHENGLDKFNIKDHSVQYFGLEEGFYPLETNQGAVSKDKNGKLWFGTVDGLIKYNPENDYVNTVKPLTYINKIELFDDEFRYTQYCDSVNRKTGLPVNLELPYNKNFLTFHFVGLHYNNPQKVKYKYKLKGFDEKWSESTKQRYTTYKKLSNGTYTFQVLAMNSDGIWNEKPVSFTFTITPPFWKTWWFYTLVFILFLFVVYQIIKARERKHIRDKRVLEEKVKERTKEIAKQKEAIEEANEELRAKQTQILAQKDEIQKQRDLAEEQRDQISKQKQEITDSIIYAERIQSAVLPPREYCKSILPEHFILFKPRDIVSGDFYWMTEKNDKIIVVAADCTGHGVPGAFMSMLGVSFFNEIVNTMSNLQANRILNRMRNYVKKTLYQRGEDDEAKDGMDLALCIIDKKKKKLQYAGAYNSLYYIRDGELNQIKADRMPIGVHVVEKDSFTNHQIDLEPDDIFYIFSDGYVDQFGGEKGSKFKSKPFKRLLMKIHEEPIEEQKEILESELDDWKGDYSQVDDIIVIGFKPEL